jgi:hypothetical protein
MWPVHVVTQVNGLWAISLPVLLLLYTSEPAVFVCP